MGGLYSYFDNKRRCLSMILGGGLDHGGRGAGRRPTEIAEDPLALLRWLIEAHIRSPNAMQPWFVFAYMEANSFPPAARRMAVESEAATEAIFADTLKRGVERGVFVAADPELAAALVKPLLQDWYVKRAKYRRRGTTIEQYVAAVSSFVEAALRPPET